MDELEKKSIQVNSNEPLDVSLVNLEDRTTREKDYDQEQAYRRGWHQGWDYSCTLILTNLLPQGYSRDELTRLIGTFERYVVEDWRRRPEEGEAGGSPTFNTFEIQRLIQNKEE